MALPPPMFGAQREFTVLKKRNALHALYRINVGRKNNYFFPKIFFKKSKKICSHWIVITAEENIIQWLRTSANETKEKKRAQFLKRATELATLRLYFPSELRSCGGLSCHFMLFWFTTPGFRVWTHTRRCAWLVLFGPLD